MAGLIKLNTNENPYPPSPRVVADYAERPAGGVVIANPNAPTGIALPLGAVEQLLQSQPQRVVLVDEAYVDFGAQSAIALVDRYPNLLVVHTLSKRARWRACAWVLPWASAT